ncbi:diguanylate cyclase (GGDEF)-like protein [Symbiobacterium terraclitae]|uniref:Diguanylate cyclase (GGDEF)-like protein n=1 Tax=Symbiobacterium terraclitae TaxID=557451 RepID=A0ABS4JV50_9FIRM|nr:diguanylate cyclase (GGDEF)-like protein [Symbiobacterium terraclitae]
MIDSYPDILDRRPFREALNRALEAEATVSLASLDLDGFGEVNARLGRESGDRLIELLCRTLAENAKAHGWTVGRIGGDEFAVVMPDTGLERAFLLMEALRGEFAARAAEQFPELCPTISIGVANAPRDARDLNGLTQQADQALYQAKENGRNAVGLPSREEMVLRSCYYTTSQLARLKKLAELLKKKESVLMREALDDLLRKYDVQ